MRVFVSYRRCDTQEIASRLASDLPKVLPDATVFQDTNDPVPGPFPRRIAEELYTADVFLAIIGPKWFGDHNSGAARIQDADDWVRLELTVALYTNRLVIPILVGTQMPNREQLPPDLQGLADYQAFELRPAQNPQWNSDMKVIANQIKENVQRGCPENRDGKDYKLAIYSALVRWIIYEAELAWRVTSAILPSLVLMAIVGALPAIGVGGPGYPAVPAAGLVASTLGFMVSFLWYTMVSRSRQFLKYRIDSAATIEYGFPTPRKEAQLFRNEFHAGNIDKITTPGNEIQRYQFGFFERISMTTSMKIICGGFMLLLLTLSLVNFMILIRGH